MNNKLSKKVSKPPAMLLEEKVVMRIIAKIADLDEQITQLAGIRVGLMTEVADMQQRLDDLEIKCEIISKKHDQSSFPSLLDEFIKAKRAKKAIQKSTRKKKSVRKKKK